MKPPPLTLDLDAVPEHLPGEPPSTARTGAALGVRVVIAAALVTLLSWALLALWVPYLALVAVYGWPPNVLRRRQIVRYLRAGWRVAPPPPGLSAGRRAWLTILVLRKAATIPLWGLAWLLDEVLYGRRLDAVDVDAALSEISAGRRGSPLNKRCIRTPRDSRARRRSSVTCQGHAPSSLLAPAAPGRARCYRSSRGEP